LTVSTHFAEYLCYGSCFGASVGEGRFCEVDRGWLEGPHNVGDGMLSVVSLMVESAIVLSEYGLAMVPSCELYLQPARIMVPYFEGWLPYPVFAD
jgi:hypothetical protein